MKLFPLLPFTLILIAPFASALLPPVGLVGFVEDVDTSGATGNFFSSVANFTFQLSPDDPDQTNGDFRYNLSTNAGQGPVTIVYYPAGGANDPTYHAIPGRPGWVNLTNFPSGPAVGGLDNYTFNVSAWDAGTQTSGTGCAVNLQLRILNYQDQCDTEIEPPAGVTGFVNRTSTLTTTGSINIKWLTSSDDPDPLAGDFNYRVYLWTPEYCCGANTPSANLGLDTAGGFGETGTDGIRFFDYVYSGVGIFQARINIRAEDPLTHERSNLSCLVTVRSHTPNQFNGCGALIAAENFTNPLLGDGPQFPLVNVSLFQQQTGLSDKHVGWFLSGILMFAMTGAGWRKGGELGAFLMTTLGFAACVFLGLLDAWLALVVFLVSVTIVVKLHGRGGSTS